MKTYSRYKIGRQIITLLFIVLLPLLFSCRNRQGNVEAITPFASNISSDKISSWWAEVKKTPYYTVDFSTFKFKTLKELKSDTKTYSKATALIKRFETSEYKELIKGYGKGRDWLLVFDNRDSFCGILKDDIVVADAGVLNKNTDQVYLNMFLNTLHLPSSVYLVDNFIYFIDNKGRIERVLCNDLELKPRGRNRKSQQYSVSFKDGKQGDNCGHLIPQALNGPAEQINFVPQKRELNSGEILSLEKKAINAKKKGYKASYEIRLIYNNNDKRPKGFENNVKVYDKNNKLINNYTGIFENR